jgi:type II secretory pathway predicted ATPase ExeA
MRGDPQHLTITRLFQRFHSMHYNLRDCEPLLLVDPVVNQTTLDFYGLRSDPLNPDPSAHPYLGSAHRNALAELYYHLEQGEKVPALVGPIGAGKTTLLRLVEKRERAGRRTLLLSRSRSDAGRLPREILGALGINSFQQDVAAVGTDPQDLLAREVRVRGDITLLVDDAQNLDDAGLRLIRSLWVLQASEKSTLKLVLAGSPELQNRLCSPEFEDILEWVPLAALAPAEIEAYIHHRLRMAGWTGNSIFLADACAAIGTRTDGVPKRVNEICSAALELGAMQQVRLIGAEWLDRNDILAATATPGGATWPESFLSRRTATTACVAIFAVVIGTALFYILRDQSRNPRAISSRVSVAVARSIDRTIRGSRGSGSSTTPTLNTLGRAKTGTSSTQPTRPMAASANLPLTNPRNEDATPTLLHSPVVSSLPQSNSVQSPAGSRHALEQSGVAQPAEPAFITSGNSPSLPREPQEPVAAVNAAFEADRRIALGNSISGRALQTPYVPNGSIAAITNTEKASDEVMIGDAYMRLADYGQALTRYQNALGMTPDSKKVQQKVSEARGAEAAKESAVINGEKSSAAMRLGDAYLLRGNYDKAISSFEGALKFTPGNRKVQERLQRAIHAKAAEDAVLR